MMFWFCSLGQAQLDLEAHLELVIFLLNLLVGVLYMRTWRAATAA